MKYLKQHASSIIMCVFEVIAGILLLINPVGFTSAIIQAFGVILVVLAIFSFVSYARMDPLAGAASQALLKGLIALVAGGFCIFHAPWFITTFPIITIIYGVAVLVAGLAKVQWTVDALRLNTGKWFLPAISAVISIVCAIIIFRNPFATTMVLWMFTGAALIVEAVFDIVSMFVLDMEAAKHDPLI